MTATPSTAGHTNELEAKLVKAGVFKGMHGLEGLYNAKEFWEQQMYGTRLHYGDGIADYLHRDVLGSAIEILKQPASDASALLSRIQSLEAALSRILKSTPHSMCWDAEAWAIAEAALGHQDGV